MTDTWHMKTFSDPMVALGPSSTLHDAFFSMCVARGGKPGTMAVFSHHDLRTNQVTWFFSPDAALLAKAFDATPCDKPDPLPGLALSVGDAASWQTHFPGHTPSSRDGL